MSSQSLEQVRAGNRDGGWVDWAARPDWLFPMEKGKFGNSTNSKPHVIFRPYF